MRTCLSALVAIVWTAQAVAGVWEKQSADSTGSDKGQYCSLVLDSKNVPHIAYLDQDFYDLRYAVYTNGGWTITVIDTSQNTGMYCSLALDAQDRPHISYQSQYINHKVLKYSVLTDTGWVTTVVDSSQKTANGEFGEASSIAIDGRGFPAISYLNRYSPSDYIAYAYLDENGWHTRYVQHFHPNSTYTQLAFRSGRVPCIMYNEVDSASTGFNWLRCAILDTLQQTWLVVTSPDSTRGTAGDYGFDVDEQGNLHCAYALDRSGYRYATYRPGIQNWTLATVPYTLGQLSLRISPAGEVGIAYMYWRGIYFLQREGAQWVNVPIDEGVSPAWFISLDYGSDGQPRVAAQATTRNSTRRGLFYYRYWSGNPQIVLSQPDHDFGTVWTQSYVDWYCPIVNQGTAPLYVNDLALSYRDTIFQLINPNLPRMILPQEADSIAIRFKPTASSLYRDSLNITSNDSSQLKTNVYLRGVGTTTGTSGDLLVRGQSAYIDHAYWMLKSDRALQAAAVSLHQGAQLVYGPIPTGTNGEALFSNVAVGTYDVRITKIIAVPVAGLTDTLRITDVLTVGPGMNTLNVAFPDSIMAEGYRFAFALAHVSRGGWDTVGICSYPSASEVRALLQLWGSALPRRAGESAARLILADSLIVRMFSNGILVGDEFISDMGELLNTIFYGDCWANSVVMMFKLLMDIATGNVLDLAEIAVMMAAQAIIKGALIDLISIGVQHAASTLPDVRLAGITLQDAVMAAWDDLKNQFTGTKNLLGMVPFYNCTIDYDNWAGLKGVAFQALTSTFYQGIYVQGLTDSKLATATANSETFSYSGEFSTAYAKTMNYVSSKTQSAQKAVSVSHAAITAADLLGVSRGFLALASFVPGIGGIIEIIDMIVRFARYGTVVTAVTNSGATFFTLPGSISNAVNTIYSPGSSQRRPGQFPPVNRPQALLPPEIRALAKQRIAQGLSSYDSTLNGIKRDIRSGDTRSAVMALEDLAAADRTFVTSMNTATAPVYAVANMARDSIPTFAALYDSVAVAFADAGVRRYANYVAVMGCRLDTVQSRRDSMLAYIDQSQVSNHRLADRVTEALDSVASLPVPAIVTVCQATQDKYEIMPGEAGVVSVQLQNVGSLAADDVQLILSTTVALRAMEPETVLVGRLTPGQKSNVSVWHVAPSAPGCTRGFWTVSVHSSNAKTYGYSSSILTPGMSTPGTGGRLSSESIYNYPNPFNPDRASTTLRYSLAATAQVTIRIYDAGGVLVRKLIDGVPMNATSEQATVWDGRNGAGSIVANGVYFYVVESSAGERAVGKIAVLR
jgi:hypothetical protein